MSTYLLKHINSHLFMEIDHNDWLIDTGAPSSFGNVSCVTIAEKTFTVPNTYVNLTANSLSEHVGHESVGLIGVDVLNEFNVIFDVINNKIELTEEDIGLEGEILPFTDVMGIPIIGVNAAGSQRKMFFDTGAQISYLKVEVLKEYPSLGKTIDFYPGVGEFETETYEVETTFGAQDMILRYGSLPQMLEMTLLMAGTEGIIGNEIFEQRVVGYFPKQYQMVFSK